jgi:hypothetical protein
VMRIWEHQVQRDLDACVSRVLRKHKELSRVRRARM